VLVALPQTPLPPAAGGFTPKLALASGSWEPDPWIASNDEFLTMRLVVSSESSKDHKKKEKVCFR